jgi:hypothetical protein
MESNTSKCFCECEHASHFDANDGHPYGAEAKTVAVKTPYGIFHVCNHCACNCYIDYPQVKWGESCVKN